MNYFKNGAGARASQQSASGSVGGSGADARAGSASDSGSEIDEPQVASMSVKELRQLCLRHHVPTDDCIEKADLRQRALQAIKKPPPGDT